MNNSSMTSSPGVAADLSQRSSASTNPILHREDSLNKVYPHLIFSSQSQNERIHEQSEHNLDVSDRFSAQSTAIGEKEDKRGNLADFSKRPLWDNIDTNPIFPDQHSHKPYEASAAFYYDSHVNPRVPQLAATPYEITPLLLKDAAMPIKHDRTLMHSTSMTLPWEKNAAALIGSMCKSPPQKPRVVNSKSSPADLEEVRNYILKMMKFVFNFLSFLISKLCSEFEKP